MATTERELLAQVRAILRGEDENAADSSSEQIDSALSLIEDWERRNDPANVRFVPGTGERVQYADATDASEHMLRVMEAGGFEPYDHDAERDAFDQDDGAEEFDDDGEPV